jgi:hypothetical protein
VRVFLAKIDKIAIPCVHNTLLALRISVEEEFGDTKEVIIIRNCDIFLLEFIIKFINELR